MKCYGPSMFITAFTIAHHLSLSWVRLIHSTPLPSYFSKTHFNIIHPPTLKSSTWYLSFMFPPPKPYMHFTSTTRPAHLISLDQISRIIFGEDRKYRISPCAILFTVSCFDVELHPWFRSRGAGTASRAWCSDTTFAHVVCAAGKYTLLRRGSGNPFPLFCQKVIINHVITYSETNATSSISSSVDRLDAILHHFNGTVVDWTRYIFFLLLGPKISSSSPHPFPST
jgi:hypothetical protein